eukprot:498554-Karenia_brevis.AAC.1
MAQYCCFDYDEVLGHRTCLHANTERADASSDKAATYNTNPYLLTIGLARQKPLSVSDWR